MIASASNTKSCGHYSYNLNGLMGITDTHYLINNVEYELKDKEHFINIKWTKMS